MTKSNNILITGASTGIGYELSKAFTQKSYRVFGSVRKQADADRLQETLGDKFEPLLFDVTDHEAVDVAVEKVRSVVGDEGLGGLVNNAGIAVGGPFIHVEMKDWRQQFEVNVLGLVKVTQAFLPLLGTEDGRKVDPGRIIQISSVSGKIASPFVSAYVGSKFAVEGISNSLRREMQLFGIDVILIGPGPIKTPIWEKSMAGNEDEAFQGSPYEQPLKIFKNDFVRGCSYGEKYGRK